MHACKLPYITIKWTQSSIVFCINMNACMVRFGGHTYRYITFIKKSICNANNRSRPEKKNTNHNLIINTS